MLCQIKNNSNLCSKLEVEEKKKNEKFKISQYVTVRGIGEKNINSNTSNLLKDISHVLKLKRDLEPEYYLPSDETLI